MQYDFACLIHVYVYALLYFDVHIYNAPSLSLSLPHQNATVDSTACSHSLL